MVIKRQGDANSVGYQQKNAHLKKEKTSRKNVSGEQYAQEKRLVVNINVSWKKLNRTRNSPERLTGNSTCWRYANGKQH